MSEGCELWPMDVFFVSSPCHLYSLLRNGLIDDADYRIHLTSLQAGTCMIKLSMLPGLLFLRNPSA